MISHCFLGEIIAEEKPCVQHGMKGLTRLGGDTELVIHA